MNELEQMSDILERVSLKVVCLKSLSDLILTSLNEYSTVGNNDNHANAMYLLNSQLEKVHEDTLYLQDLCFACLGGHKTK